MSEQTNPFAAPATSPRTTRSGSALASVVLHTAQLGLLHLYAQIGYLQMPPIGSLTSSQVRLIQMVVLLLAGSIEIIVLRLFAGFHRAPALFVAGHVGYLAMAPGGSIMR